MIECTPDADLGRMAITGTTRNGKIRATREVVGMDSFLLRRGEQDIATGGFILEDTEAPVGRDVVYRVTSTPTDRTIQRNLALTPNFNHGLQGWTTGGDRALTTQDDPGMPAGINYCRFEDGNGDEGPYPCRWDAAIQGNGVGTSYWLDGPYDDFGPRLDGTVARVGPAAANVLNSPPTLIGHTNLTAYTNGTYSLTGSGSGGTALVAGDWLYLIHNQINTIADPVVTVGDPGDNDWELVQRFTVGTRISTSIYRRKYTIGGGAIATVTVPTGGSALATMLWVRGAADVMPDFSPAMTADGTLITNVVSIPRAEFINPSLVLTIASAETRLAGTLVGSSNVTGATWQYTVGTSPNTRSTVIAAESATIAGIAKPTTITFSAQPEAPTWFGAVQMAIPNGTTLNNRVVLKGKLAALPMSGGPYLVTARVRYVTTGVWLWNDVKLNGTWQALKTAKANWGAVKTSAILATGEPYGKLLAVMVDPATGYFYTKPQQVLGVTTEASNAWLDLSFYMQTPMDIPATAELWFLHGSTVREHNIVWYFDKIGVRNRADWQDHDSAYYIDGDTGIPADPANMMASDGQVWIDVSMDSYVAWTGVPGNSTSILYGPSVLAQETSCFLDLPYITTCTPALLSDPVRSLAALWTGLLGIDSLKHPSNSEVYEILSRADAIAVGGPRNLETGQISFLTRTFNERYKMIEILRPGRVMLLRIGEDGYPEDNWYLALGDFSEDRLSQDHADPTRTWTASFVHVLRPSGFIETSFGAKWSDVKALGPWSDVRTQRTDWLDVITTEPVDAP